MILKKAFALFSFLVIILNFCFSQALIKDTIVIGFGTSIINPINIPIDTIIDNRKMPPDCINISEKTKYLYIPVDFFTNVKQPISKEIRSLFEKRNTNNSVKLRLEINEFNVAKNKELFKLHYYYNAAISIYQVDKGKLPKYLGTLIYENDTIFRKDKPKANYPIIIDTWKRGFTADLDKVYLKSKGDSSISLYNYIQEPMAWKKNMIVGISYCQGLAGEYLIDGEIIFSRPESQKKFFRVASSLRYRYNKKYSSFETSITDKQVNYRFNNDYLITLKSKLFFGLNLWNNNEYAKHGLEDVFLLNASFSQNFTYNPFHKKSIILGIGVLEDITFIYSQKADIKPFLVGLIGIKL